MNKRTILFGVFTVTFALLCCSVRADASSQPYLNGHEINFGTGNKYVSETDISLDGPVRLTFSRTYNSQSTVSGVLGYGWSASFTEKLIDATSTITLVRSDGRHVLHFRLSRCARWSQRLEIISRERLPDQLVPLLKRRWELSGEEALRL